MKGEEEQTIHYMEYRCFWRYQKSGKIIKNCKNPKIIRMFGQSDARRQQWAKKENFRISWPLLSWTGAESWGTQSSQAVFGRVPSIVSGCISRYEHLPLIFFSLFLSSFFFRVLGRFCLQRRQERTAAAAKLPSQEWVKGGQK